MMTKEIQSNPKKFAVYRQSTVYTCTPACAIMVFHHFSNASSLTTGEEMRVHNIIRFWKGGEGEYGSYPKLAIFAMENSYSTKLLFKLKCYPDPMFISKDLYRRYLENYLPYIELAKVNPKFELQEGEFGSEELARELEKGRLVIAEINYPPSYPSHNVVLFGYDGRYFDVADPIKGLYRVTKRRWISWSGLII